MHTTVTGFMAVWLSGVIFLLCCSTMSGKAMDAEFCPLAKMSAHCDKSKASNSAAAFVEDTEKNKVDCCAFLPAVFDKARKVERNQQPAVTTPKFSPLSFVSPQIAKSTPISRAFLAHLPDGQHSFIKNCVFRL